MAEAQSARAAAPAPTASPVPNRTPGAGPLVVVGIVLGLLGDGLFRGAGWGVNIPLWIGALTIAGWWSRRGMRGPTPWLTGLMLLFAACCAWRASPFLRFWNLAAVLAAAVAVVIQLRHRLSTAWIRDYVYGGVVTALQIGAGPVLAANVIGWPWNAGSKRTRTLQAVAIGAALAIPVVVVFGALLASADPVMEAFVARVFDWNVRRLLEHLGIILLLGWVATGWLWGITEARPGDHGPRGGPSRRLGGLELGIPLGALLVLLVTFVGIQARYFFGGDAILLVTGMTYAEFARRGFFELVLATTLVVPLLLLAQWLLDRSQAKAVESFRALVVALLAVVLLVMASALARMKLYVNAYGLTEDRLYASVFMGWIGFLLVLLAVTEVRARTERFATGAVLAGFAVVAVLNVVNPDALIARTNLGRAEQGLVFDPVYLSRLSADAIPAIAARWSSLDRDARCTLEAGVLSRVGPLDDWRVTTWSGWRARRALDTIEPEDEPCPSI